MTQSQTVMTSWTNFKIHCAVMVDQLFQSQASQIWKLIEPDAEIIKCAFIVKVFTYSLRLLRQ
jgi:predicted secreted protein